MPSIRRTTRREKTFRAWSGETGEVERLALVLQDLLDRRLKTMDAAHAGNAGVVLTFRDGPDEVAGPWSEVLPEMDPRTVHEFSLSATIEAEGVEEERASLEFSRKPSAEDAAPIRLHVDSCDQGWARQAFVSLQEELEKGVPWWNLIHTRLGGLTFAWVLFFSTLFVLLRLVGLLPLRGASSPDEIAPREFVATLVIGALFAVFLVRARWIREWFFPRLEIVRNGAGQGGGRRVALLGTLGVELLIGITVNLIS